LRLEFQLKFRNKFFFLNAEKFRFSAEFIEMRRQALDVFINRIASHPVLRKSEDLRTFLLEEEEVIFPFIFFIFKTIET
jgi:PX domain